MTGNEAAATCAAGHPIGTEDWSKEKMGRVLTCSFCLLHLEKHPEIIDAIPNEQDRKLLKITLSEEPIADRPADGPLQKRFGDWIEVEGATFELAVIFGLVPDGQESWLKHKGIFWTNNKLSNSLYKILIELTLAGVLERRTEPDEQYRWHGSKKG